MPEAECLAPVAEHRWSCLSCKRCTHLNYSICWKAKQLMLAMLAPCGLAQMGAGGGMAAARRAGLRWRGCCAAGTVAARPAEHDRVIHCLDAQNGAPRPHSIAALPSLALRHPAAAQVNSRFPGSTLHRPARRPARPAEGRAAAAAAAPAQLRPHTLPNSPLAFQPRPLNLRQVVPAPHVGGAAALLARGPARAAAQQRRRRQRRRRHVVIHSGRQRC